MTASILVVEDIPVLAKLAAQMVVEAGYDVLGPYDDAEVALAVVETGKPVLALLNIDLGEGGNGIDLAAKLSESHNILSIFVSGDVDETRAANSCALGYIHKPYSPDVLVATIHWAVALIEGRPPPPKPKELTVFDDHLEG